MRWFFVLLFSGLFLTSCNTEQAAFWAEAGEQSPIVRSVSFAVVGDRENRTRRA